MRKKTKTPFGEFLVAEIRQAGITQEEFYRSVGITKPYFYDILRLSPPPPALQDQMIAVLDNATGSNEERRNRFYDLAAQGRNEIPADIVKILLEHRAESDKVRMALSALLEAQNEGE